MRRVISAGGTVKKMWVVMFAALLPSPAMRGTAQQATNPLTTAQCQSDAAVWLPTLEAQGGTIAITYETLGGWADEMMQCQTVDAANREKYFNVAAGAVAERANRETNYLVRHGLYKQFLAEDVAGKRGL
jgi:chromosome condensin MukBEF complex kleisin-like MukF subunit